MKIGATSSPAADAAALARSNAEVAAALAAKAKSVPEHGASSVQLSSAATGLLAAQGVPEFDAAKVERLRQAIADGSYRVNPEAIADKLIANAQEVLAAAAKR